MKIQFKTGRCYTEHGQRIIAETLEHKGIIFHDIDRNISGFIPWHGLITHERDLKETLMFCYDRGNYTWSAEAMDLEWQS